MSIEEGIVERFGIAVGDVMRFDVLGRPIHARVSGVRRVEWREGAAAGSCSSSAPGHSTGAALVYRASAGQHARPDASARG